MEKLIVSNIFILLGALLYPQASPAQGTITYLSNLSSATDGGFGVGSNSPAGALFETGKNAGGYVLNSIQLEMADAIGSNPNGFTVTLFNVANNLGSQFVHLGSSFSALNSSANPSTAEIYTYTDDSNLTLSPDTFYFFVLSAGTTYRGADDSGAEYGWLVSSNDSYNPINSWGGSGGLIISQGPTWGLVTAGTAFSFFPLYAITATPVSEPSSCWLLLPGSGVFICVRRTIGLKP